MICAYTLAAGRWITFWSCEHKKQSSFSHLFESSMSFPYWFSPTTCEIRWTTLTYMLCKTSKVIMEYSSWDVIRVVNKNHFILLLLWDDIFYYVTSLNYEVLCKTSSSSVLHGNLSVILCFCLLFKWLLVFVWREKTGRLLWKLLRRKHFDSSNFPFNTNIPKST